MRMPISCWRAVARASTRLATFVHATTRSSIAAAMSRRSVGRAGPCDHFGEGQDVDGVAAFGGVDLRPLLPYPSREELHFGARVGQGRLGSQSGDEAEVPAAVLIVGVGVEHTRGTQ